MDQVPNNSADQSATQGYVPNPRMMSIREKLARMAPRKAVEILGPELLKTQRLVLRPLMPKDRAQFVEAIANSRPQLERYYDLWQPGDTDDAVFDRQLELTRLGAATGTACRRGAFLQDGRFVGCFNISGIERGLEFTGEAAWWIRSDLGRMGLGTEGVKGMLEYAIDETTRGGLGLLRVVAHLHPQNIASRRLATKAGMHEEYGKRVAVKLHNEWVPHITFVRKVLLAA